MSQDATTETPVIEEVTLEVPIPIEPALPPVTSAAEWRRKATARYRVTLPSGAVVEARRMDVPRLVGEGRIAPELFVGGTATERYQMLRDAAKATIASVLVEPALTPEDIDAIWNGREGDFTTLFLWSAGMMTIPAVEVV